MTKPPIDYIDTQGLSPKLSPEEAANVKPVEHKPATVTPRRLFTPTFAKEMKILINEVLDERDGKRGISYFDTEHFKHYVGEDEPPYERWE
tara:strand:+ start:273 stop:545 length:273 start_codon:yes stop_codon:yes gene_type:complete